ncbi:NERD domain-containing protein [Bacillus sp. JJ722]|uniref:NERD domain-containing protein n=1 Tax=Bacillus sp. JJ722 TaxID=3122973 RepID=UPI003000C725
MRLKKQQWERVNSAFQNGELYEFFPQDEPDNWLEEDPGFFEKFKSMFKRQPKEVEEKVEEPESKDAVGSEIEERLYQDKDLQLTLTFMPKNIDELKIAFLNHMFKFQMKWATSTVREKSLVDQDYYVDEKLKFLLQRFPDTFLVLYQPVFRLNKAPVELETIVLTPNATWCISFLEDEEDSVFDGSNGKFWVRRHHQREEKRVLNPSISLHRTEVIVKKLYSLNQVDLPIKKAIISRNGYIDYPAASYDLVLLDKKNFTPWFESMRKLSSPLKHHQLKGADVLLENTQTTSVHRLEWNDYNDFKTNIE